MYSAKDIVGRDTMSVIDKGGSIRKSFFWYPDKKDPKKIAPLSKHNAFRYVREFLPSFGFYKFREDDDEENTPCLIVQKKGRRVKIIGWSRTTRSQTRSSCGPKPPSSIWRALRGISTSPTSLSDCTLRLLFSPSGL